MQAHQGQQAPGPGQEAPRSPVIRGVREDHGESEMNSEGLGTETPAGGVARGQAERRGSGD